VNGKDQFDQMKLKGTRLRAESMSSSVKATAALVRALYAQGCSVCRAPIAGVFNDKALCSVNSAHEAGSIAPERHQIARLRSKVEQVVARSLARRKRK
jgi:hypothetical protein